jgi:hypothetical protein
MLALAVTKLPRRTGLGVQLKFDGYRALRIEAKGKVPLLSHNDKGSTPSNRFTRVDSQQKLNYKRSPMSVCADSLSFDFIGKSPSAAVISRGSCPANDPGRRESN